MIPLSVPEVSGNEWKYIKECLDTGWVSSVGGYVSRFESDIQKYTGSAHAVATASGTSALHLSLLCCGVEPNDEVIVPDLTFVAAANVVTYCRAFPVFMDCDRETLCLDVGKLNDFLSKECDQKGGAVFNRKSNRRIRAVMPVHVFGHPCDMEPLLELAKNYNLSVIEDATESIGSTYKDKMTGTFGEIGCLSFNGNKIMTTGGGGMVLTDNIETAKKVKHLSTQAKNDEMEYDHDQVGYNYRLTNIQAAMGVAQLEQLNKFIKTKRGNADNYREQFSQIDHVEFLGEQSWAKSNMWLYTIRVPKKHKGPLIQHLISKDIEVRPIWKLMHTLPMFKGCQAYKIENASEAYDTCINIPCSVSIKKEQIDTVVESVKEYLSKTLNGAAK